MTSQLNVDTIVDKAGSGGTNVKIANTSVTVAEGGSATTTTVQGLTKVGINFNGEGTVAIRDSFNVSSLDDDGTGEYGINFTNNMGNNNYFPSGMAEGDGKVVINDSAYSTHVSTSALNIDCKTGGSFVDREVVCTTIDGDLA